MRSLPNATSAAIATLVALSPLCALAQPIDATAPPEETTAGGAPTTDPGPDPATEWEPALRFAQDAFIYGDYAGVAETLGPLLLPVPPPIEPRKLTISLTLLGVSAYFTGDLPTADEAFLQLLLIDARHTLDPLLYPADVLDRFEQVRAANRDRLTPEDPPETAFGATVYVETRVHEQSFLVSVLPFGYGFFTSDRDAWGTAYLLTEALLGATSVSLFWANELDRDARGYHRNPSAAEIRRDVHVATGIAFFGVVLINAIHGALTHESVGRVEYRTTSESPMELRPEGQSPPPRNSRP